MKILITNLRVSFLAVCFFVVSCETQQATWETSKIRESVLDYYNDEVMDNLIAASKQLPFIHVDLQTLTAGVTQKVSSTVNGGQSIQNTATHQLTHSTGAIVTTLARQATRPFTFAVTPERDSAITFNSEVATDPSVYDAYKTYLDKTHNAIGGTAQKPTEAIVPGTLKFSGNLYYYIPMSRHVEYSTLIRSVTTKKNPLGGGKTIESIIKENEGRINTLQNQLQQQ